MREAVFEYIEKKYHVFPDYPWGQRDSSAVFRHAENNKWFALVMCVQRNKLGPGGEDWVDIINLKVEDRFFRDMIIQEAGIMPAYHMNKQCWITVFLDKTVAQEQVFHLIDMSFMATALAKKKEKLRPPKENAGSTVRK